MLHLTLVSICIVLGAAAVSAQPAPPPPIPHLAQAWVAQSSGDGLPGEAGKESYIYGDCPRGVTSDDCMNAHIFDYGASDCIKIEIDAGFHSNASGTWLVKCDATDCCYEGDENGEPADVKKWDISHPVPGHFNPIRPFVTYLGQQTTTGLNGEVVKNADVWREVDHLPFTKEVVNYTYFITYENNGSDTISHRIDIGAPSNASGSILFGDFQVQHDLPTFRETIRQYVLSEPSCLRPNTLQCPPGLSKKWGRKRPGQRP